MQLARWGENIAKIYLEGQQILILKMNFRTIQGEIDIIGKNEEGIIFFEVKTRSSKKFGFPEEAVDNRKIEKIECVANEYLDNQKMDDVNWRIDTIAIIRNPYSGNYEVKWFKNVGY